MQARRARRVHERLRLSLVDERVARLPVANLRVERVHLGGEHVRRVRDDEVERPGGKPVVQVRVQKLDVKPGERRVLARERERVGRGVERDDARVGPLVLRARARSRRCPCPTSRTRGSGTSRSSTRQRSTTCSVSGRGTSARASHRSVSRRKPHSPRTYASGSRAARRSTRGQTAASSRTLWLSATKSDLFIPSACATIHSASTRGVGDTGSASVAAARSTISSTVIPARAVAPRPAARS